MNGQIFDHGLPKGFTNIKLFHMEGLWYGRQFILIGNQNEQLIYEDYYVFYKSNW